MRDTKREDAATGLEFVKFLMLIAMVLILLFWGNPDIHDAIIQRIMDSERK